MHSAGVTERGIPPSADRHPWPRLMRLKTAAAYLDMTPSRFLAEVATGRLPEATLIGGGERWDRHAIDSALDESAEEDDWRAAQPGLNMSLEVPRRPSAAEVYSVASLAEYWGCSTGKIYALIHNQQLESFKLGDQLYRIKHSAVEAFAAAQARPTTAPGKSSDAALAHLERLAAGGSTNSGRSRRR